MNRSISNVLIGGFGDGAGGPTKKAKKAEGTVKEVSPEDVIEMMTDAKSIIIVPGYGMAVAKAQHAIAELTIKLRARGVNVRFAVSSNYYFQYISREFSATDSIIVSFI
jgi:NAD/NADP transhydrogenase beta subunit